MSKEEILRKHFTSTNGYTEANWNELQEFRIFKSVLGAMEEYAQLQKELAAIAGACNVDGLSKIKRPLVLAGPPNSGKTFIANSIVTLFPKQQVLQTYSHTKIDHYGIKDALSGYKLIVVEEFESFKDIVKFHTGIKSFFDPEAAFIYTTQATSTFITDLFRVIYCQRFKKSFLSRYS